MNLIPGGITAAKGFRAGAIHAGVKSKKPDRLDLALIVSDVPCAAAGVYTRNLVKAAPVILTREHLADGKAQGIVVNSGNANACAPNARAHAERTAILAEELTGIPAKDFIISSTGVIGQELNIASIEAALPALVQSLDNTDIASDLAARAIMTTDTVKKEFAIEFTVGGKICHMGVISKGSGMIHPNMGTTLTFMTTDCAISSALLQKALYDTVQVTMNRVSVDGDTSTNDTCCILANGLAENPEITAENEEFTIFCAALKALLTEVSRAIAADGEGATHLLTVTVKGAKDEKAAETLAKSIVCSSLTKAAIFGTDANWGRVLCAMGYSGAAFNPEKTDIFFASAAGEILVCKDGTGIVFDEDKAKTILQEHEVIILCDCKEGAAEATCWGCDLTYEYVKINGDYRT